MRQVILVSDKFGKHTGEYIDKDLAHKGKGKRHLAITVLLYNSRGQVLLQHRKHKIHNDIWDFSGSTHHLHKADGADESTEEAAYRCLREEWGIRKKIDLKILGGVNYFAQDGKNCENEHDIIVVGKWDGVLKPNKSVSYGHKWVKEEFLLSDISKNPKKYAPWAVLGSAKLNKPNSEFEALLNKFLTEFEAYSKAYFKKRRLEVRKYPALIGKFYEDLDDISAGGKRMRGFLVYLGYLIGGGRDLKRILPICLAVEIVHTFLLIHDDIVDKSDTRRGKLAIHKRYEKKFGGYYGISQAILIGDIASFEAIRLVNSSGFDSKLKLVCEKRIIDVLLETAYGEALDVEYSYKRAKVEDILNVADLKTARYSFVGPMSVGAVLGGMGKRQLKPIERFGLKIGLAFQLADDLLGIFGDERILGKSTLSDMREGKNTLIIFKAKELASKNSKKRLEELWGRQDADKKDLEDVKKIIKECGAYDWCIFEMSKLSKGAAQNINAISKDALILKVLQQISDYIVSRSS